MSFEATPVHCSSVRTDRIRITALLAKKEGMSDDEFLKYWREVHGPMFANLQITKKNLLLYEQHPHKNDFGEAFTSAGYGVVSYHGTAVFEAESYEKIFEIFQSDEYARVNDEVNFLARDKTAFVVGPIITYMDKIKDLHMPKYFYHMGGF